MIISTLSKADIFPRVRLPTINGQYIELAQSARGLPWQMIVIYRGEHSPSCTKFLNKLDQFREPFADIGIDIVAASADNSAQLQRHLKELTVSYPIAFGLTVEHMYNLNLHVSMPKDLQETNHPFAEPALFVIDEKGKIVLSDIANNPYTRPNLEQLLVGINSINHQ